MQCNVYIQPKPLQKTIPIPQTRLEFLVNGIKNFLSCLEVLFFNHGLYHITVKMTIRPSTPKEDWNSIFLSICGH